MKIAIQASDLDHPRIDGTRVYILNLLKSFGMLDKADDFLIYHKGEFNPALEPPKFPNYDLISKKFPFCWTQTRFAYEIWKDKPDVLWMPMQALPILRRKKLKTVITVHDLAFKIFPECFPAADLRRLNFYSDYAIKNATKIIAVSESTKNDILKFYPEVDAKKIRVIHHGFDAELFQKDYSQEELKEVYTRYKILNTRYLLYVGAIQPRKNLILFVEAFEKLKNNPENRDLKLVLAGESAWQSEKTLLAVGNSSCSSDIVLTGRVGFSDLAKLFQGAEVFVFPSLYEGFGIPVLEAFASSVPAIVARNSSLTEVGGDAALYFQDNDADDLAEKIRLILSDRDFRDNMIKKGREQIKNFSWEKCAKETLKFIKE